ncbi:hypothetical protein LTS18_009641, partial [Coniosporium uncinatum]
MGEHTRLTDLPLDILYLVFPYLDAKSFVSLCRTCKAFYHPDIRLEHSYWSHVARSTFRVPNHPVVQADGQRWQALYKRLLTQSRVFTWGSNGHGCLGHSYELPPLQPPHAPRLGPMRGPRHGPPGLINRRGAAATTKNRSVPTEVEIARELGIIADLQCGGWSTTILNDKGVLYSCGQFDGERTWVSNPELGPLRFPPGYPQPKERYDPYVATRQFSSGRSHVLAVTDSGTIWSWHDVTKPAMHIKFLHIDIMEQPKLPSSSTRGYVKKVVAGWNKSSAYISGTGIVLWDIVRSPPRNLELDTMLVAESVVVPKSSYQRPSGAAREPNDEARVLGEEIGEITSFIVLEAYVVFTTHIHKAFCAKIDWNPHLPSISLPIELSSLHSPTPSDPTPSATDVQGSFRSFAIFLSTGAVITAKQEYLDSCYAQATTALDASSTDLFPTPQRIPSLQNNGVIQLAFGDYHFH